MTPLLTIERVALLHSVEFFAGVPTYALASVAELATEVEHGAGDRLMVEGEDGDCLYVIAAGRVRIERGGRAIAEMGPGEVVGELAVLSPGARTATAGVTEAGRFLRVGAEVMDELLLDHPDVARSIIEVLVQRLRPAART